jgi:hypothetical protein
VTPRNAIEGAVLVLVGWLALGAQPPAARQPLFTGRCRQDLPLDAGEGFDHQRYLVQKDQAWLFDRDWQSPGPRSPEMAGWGAVDASR